MYISVIVQETTMTYWIVSHIQW